ncbi:hypothetical protein LJ756_03020 [Arthrobacter sp. zg-Y411]|uniref:hypothetical protein n=1 Tax=Arthrobacter zhangbolii TaxID=2886936 RepID=UPI001D133D8D|nr:hypothetical protein [Arthrobacter zhangbolii]MCC3293594.1 hypothetical protein [Arthrobacter zhangbolii]
MMAGVIGTVFGIGVTVGLVTLVVFLTARRKAKKAGPGARVEFNPRGLKGVLLFVGAIAVLVWLAVLMAINSDRPSWVFSVGIVFLLGMLRPVIQKQAGSMFVVSGEGKGAVGTPATPDGYYSPAQFPAAQYPAAQHPPAQAGPAQYPAAQSSPAQYPAAQSGPAQYPSTHFMSGEAVSAQYGAPAEPAGGTPEPDPRPAGTKKPLTRRQADFRLLYLPAAASVAVALVLGFGGNWTAAGFLMGLAVISALSYVMFRRSVSGPAGAKAAAAAQRGEGTPG